MIIATIQGKNKKEETITTLNGEFIHNDEEQRYIDEIYRNTRKIKYKNKQGIYPVKDKFLAFAEHPENDDIGRIRTAMIFYDKNTSKKEIDKTLEVMGLDIRNFNELLNKYKQKRIIINVTVFLTLTACAIFLYYLF